MTVLRSIPAPAQVLLGSNALAHVVTQNPDGSPQVSVVWCGVRDDQVVFCAERATAKVRNIERNPAVVLSIEDEARNMTGTQQHLLVYGDAKVTAAPADKALCDELCRVYVGSADHPLNLSRSTSSVTVTVDVRRIGGNGPWTLDD